MRENITDWNEVLEELKVRYSNAYAEFGADAVDILRGSHVVLRDMAPSVLSYSKFPKPLIKAARLVCEDGRTRMFKGGKIVEAPTIWIP